jgi:hypothetical protein
MKKTKTMPKLFCSKCGARAFASCNCEVGYTPARVVAERAIKEHPERSNRSIAAQTGISHETIRQVREATANNLAVRIGLDGKVRRVPSHLVPFKRTIMPDETPHIPAAEQLLENIDQTLKELRRENEIRPKSPKRVGELVRDLLTRIFKSGAAARSKIEACRNCALEWPIDGIPTKQDIDAVSSVIDAWSDLRDRMLAAAEDRVMAAAE